MKKSLCLFTILVATVLFWACTSEEGVSDVGIQVNTGIRSIDDAMQIAEKSYLSFYGRSGRSASAPVCSKENCYVVKGRSSRGLANDTMLYVINFDNNEGFALINPMENKVPLLGITEEGHYNPDEGTDNENFDYFMDKLSVYLTLPGDSIFSPNVPGTFPSTIESVSPKVKVLWGQHSPYGDECSNGVAGCANTAMAMVISYFEFPQVLPLTYPNHPRSSVIFNWDDLHLHAKAPNRGCQETHVTETHAALAQLCRELGYRAGSVYNPGSSAVKPTTGTDLYAPINVLSDMGYSVSSLYYFTEERCRTALRGSNLVYMLGWASEGGHAWIMDGYKVYATGSFLVGGTPSTKTYFHYNWGWDGDCNGYFLSNVFDTSSATDYDNPEWTDHNSNYTDDIIYFIVSNQ